MANPITVVLVDDVVDIRELIRMQLELEGRFTVVAEAGDGLQGVAVIEQHQPDFVLLDLAMPVMDGLTALPEIHRVAPSSRVVVLSAFEESRMRDKALSLCAEDYVEKGSPAKTLPQRLEELHRSPRKSSGQRPA
jgi:DNA-binding NarL/FixJ family response regulator